MGSARERFTSSSNRAAASFRRASHEAYEAFVAPPFLERRLESATVAGQWIAASALILLVPLSFRMILVGANITERLVFGISFISTRTNAPFIVTLINLVLVILASWFWFQWVRTAGFGMTNVGGGQG